MLCILAQPRSRTAWLANWLTYADSRCLHEPLADCERIEDLPAVLGNATAFVETCGAKAWPAIAAQFPDATLVVIHRPAAECAASADALGLADWNFEAGEAALLELPGKVFRFDQLSDLDTLRELWAMASKEPMDEPRTRMLIGMNVQLTKDRLFRGVKNLAVYGLEDEMLKVNASPKVRQIIAGSRIAISDDKFPAMFEQAMQQSQGDLAATAAILVFSLIQKGIEQTGDAPPEELYQDEGAADAILSYLIQWAADNGYLDPNDIEAAKAIHNKALDMIEDAAVEHDAQMAAGQQDGPQQSSQQPGPQAPPNAPAVPGGLMG